MGRRTALFDSHVSAGAKIVDFGGWDMPLNYGSQLDEHHAVRERAGLFDVSHMTVVDLDGSEVEVFLSRLLANDVGKLRSSGRAMYTCMLNREGGIIDDLIVYRLANSKFRMIVNAATRDKDLQWIASAVESLGSKAQLRERSDLAMLAVQGPRARTIAAELVPDGQELLGLRPFHAAAAGDMFVARTGYTGEDGWEILVPTGVAAALWQGLVDAGAQPCGLGARDSLRLEAGLNLYGSDMDETTTPYESNLAWTVSLESEERDFIGRAALERQLARGVTRRLAGLVLKDKGVLRAHQRVITSNGDGETTSGGFSPTLGRSIALARLPAQCDSGAQVEIRGRHRAVSIVSPPFVRDGKPNIVLDRQMTREAEE